MKATLEDLLTHTNAHVQCGDRRLMFNDAKNQWEVLKRKGRNSPYFVDESFELHELANAINYLSQE